MPDAATRVRNYKVGSQGGRGALRNLQTVSLLANTAQGRPSNRKYVEMEADYGASSGWSVGQTYTNVNPSQTTACP